MGIWPRRAWRGGLTATVGGIALLRRMGAGVDANESDGPYGMPAEARLAHEPCDLGVGRLLGALHQGRVPDYVGRQDRRLSPLNLLFGHSRPLDAFVTRNLT
jgi:hypothetical protein